MLSSLLIRYKRDFESNCRHQADQDAMIANQKVPIENLSSEVVNQVTELDKVKKVLEESEKKKVVVGQEALKKLEAACFDVQAKLKATGKELQATCEELVAARGDEDDEEKEGEIGGGEDDGKDNGGKDE